jgi:cysteine-rich repeat protein
VAGSADAAPTTDPTQAPAGAIVIHFDEFAVPNFTDVTNQYMSLGATFPSPPAWAQNDYGATYPGIFGPSIDNFSGSSICETTYSIVFAAPVGFAGFDIVTNAGDNTDLTATLGGAFVESHQFVTDAVMGGFIGFDNPGGFDRLDVSVQHNVNGCMVIDELTFSGSNCGDGMIDGAEACDDGGESATCDANCTLVVCGDGTFNATAGEECDEGGATPTCNADCTMPFCGDGVVNMPAGEECDDAGESATCDSDCTSVSCGDDVTNMAAGEECDDSAQSPTCDADCTLPVCGDAIENNLAGEVCDDGNTVDCDGCRGDCSAAEDGCGDGFLCSPEECDDANVVDGDGCSSTCIDETAGTTSSGGSSEGGSSSDGGESSTGGESGPTVDESGSGTDDSGSASATGASATGASATMGAETSGGATEGETISGTDGLQRGTESGCGCASDRSRGATWVWLIALAAVRRRRPLAR